MRRSQSITLFTSTLVLFAAACGVGAVDPNPDDADTHEDALDEAAASSDRGGVGLSVDSSSDPVTAAAVVIDPRKSLLVTDQVILSGFTFKGVMDQLVAQSGVTGLTSLALFHQWWDTENAGPGLGLGAHCNDQLVGGAPALNGFPHVCPRVEGSQASLDPFLNPTTSIASYLPIAVVNRFDLAPSNGATCGEYRVIFARRSGLTNFTNRNFIIFEAALANPRLDLGIEGCRPVLNFWASLSTKTAAERAPLLKSFYFTGLTGFSPVIHIDNYGNATTRPTGQVRTNQFMQFNWNLREFKINKTCPTATTCAMRFVPATDKTNPFADLFRSASTQPLKAEFEGTGTTSFSASVAKLAVNDINTFNYAPNDKFNAGESDSQSGASLYTAAFGTAASPFRTAIQSKLTAIGSTLTPDQIVARAQALSCAGCHELSNGADLGGGLTWPSSGGFTHVSESSETGPDGARFTVSPALSGTFLPRRKVVFESMLNRAPKNSSFVSQTVPTTVTRGQVFNVTVAFRNTGSTSWTELNQFRLASESPSDNTRWGKSRVTLGATEKINLNSTNTFTFSVTAPATAGTFVFQWRMIDDPGVRFGALSTPVNIVVN